MRREVIAWRLMQKVENKTHFQRSNLGCKECNAKLLYSMKYYMITALGKSTLINYFGCLASVYGIGQGSTAGPPGWTLISNINLKVYHWMCKGCAIANSAQKMKVQCNTDMFVDDVTLLHNNGNKFITSAQQLMNHIQHDSEIWGRLLWFAASGKPYIVPEELLSPNKVTVTDANVDTTKLIRVTERKGIKMLG
eukprot:10769212-Ditylum_brightwellii.AAC.1